MMVKKMPRTKKTGIAVNPPKDTCEDPRCPFHGTLKIRGNIFTGTVMSDRMQKSIIVEWTGLRFIPKYERYRKTKTRILAHNPKCINAKEGDVVTIGECRPISKTKNFVVLSVKGHEKTYDIKKEAIKDAKHKAKAKEDANKAKTKDAGKAKPEAEE